MPAPAATFDLEQVLMEVRSDAGDVGQWTVGHAVEGIQIFGGIGSGKTSGSGRTLALKFLRAGFGGLVLTAKPDEKELWEEYCALAGRSQDLVVLEPGGPNRFNFLHYEATQAGGQQALTANIVQVLKTVISASEEKGGGKGDNAFWESALEMLIFNVIDLCQLAYGHVAVKDMYEIVQSIPQSNERLTPSNPPDEIYYRPFGRAYLTAKAKTDAQVRTWQEDLRRALSPEEYEALCADTARYQEWLAGAVPETTLLQLLYDFFIGTFQKLSERTRSTIDLMFTGFLYHLMREPVYSLLCSGTSNVTPDASLQGKIILLNLPVKTYQKVGQDCQVMFKYIWQRAMEKRNVRENGRPVFLWADEAQNFLHEHDAVYQATARSSRIATVYISQNLPNYYASMGGGDKADNRVKSFLGTLNTKIFHANADRETTEYASSLIGEEFYVDKSRTTQYGDSPSTSQSESLKLTRRVRPEEFYRLKTGGNKNKLKVEGYMLWQGNTLLPDRNHQKVTFSQAFGQAATT